MGRDLAVRSLRMQSPRGMRVARVSLLGALCWAAACGSSPEDAGAPMQTIEPAEAAPPAHAPLAIELDSPPPFLTGDAGQLRFSAHVLGDPSAFPSGVQQRWAVADEQGRELRVMTASEAPPASSPGALSALWDGRDSAGERLPAGRYTVSVELIAGHAPMTSSAMPQVMARSPQAGFDVLPASVDTTVVCPLLGADAHNPATLQPEMKFAGTDMGMPVVIGDRIYFLFGDTWTREVCLGTDEPYASLHSDDLLASMPLQPEPDPNGCLELALPVLPDDPTKFQPMLVDYDKPIDLLALGVASVGFNYQDKLYAIFSPYEDVPCDNSSQCVAPAQCHLNVCTYRELPVFPPRVLAVSDMEEGRPTGHFTGFTELTDVNFTNIAARTVNRIGGDGGGSDYGNDAPSELLVFGRYNYFAGVDENLEPRVPELFLFRQPLASLIGDERFAPLYFAGYEVSGAPRWSEDGGQAVPIVAPDSEVAAVDGDPAQPPTPIYFPANMAVSTIPPFGAQGFRWLMVYGGRSPAPVDFYNTDYDPRIGIFFRLARDPWGPWTPPRRLWSVYSEDGPKLIYRPGEGGIASDPGRGPRGCDVDAPYEDVGVEYSPQVLERWTKVEGNTLTLHWFMSVWNPYRVIQMRSTVVAE